MKISVKTTEIFTLFKDTATAVEIAGWLTDELGEDAFMPREKP